MGLGRLVGVFFRGRQPDEFEPRVVGAVGELLAAAQAGGSASEGTDAFEFGFAVGAEVDVFDGDLASWQGEVVAAGFIGETEVGTGALPLRAMGGDAAFTDAVLGNEVGQFVEERTFDLVGSEGLELGIEENDGELWVGKAGGAPHPGVPENAQAIGERSEAD